jgi:hypothetical protein
MLLPLCAVAAAFAVALSQTPASGGGGLEFKAPPEWKTRAPASSMRVAEFVLPGAEKAQDAELVVYYFGGSGGNVDANIQRWLGQMQQPDGRATEAVAVKEARTINGLKVSTLDVTGTYVAEVRPGSTERHNSPGFRMRTAVVETPGGPYFIKLVGPAATVAKWNGAFKEFLDSLRFAK